jgi:Cu+-exporting ATPase
MSSKAAGSLRALLSLAPETARRKNLDGNEEMIPVAQLRLDDKIVLKPGDRIPTDGELLDGNSAVDESMLTGESLPIDKKSGDKLYAGTINMNGQLLMRVTAVGEKTALAHIIEAVQRAQTSRASIQRLGDQVSNVFVPIVIVIALVTATFWGFFPQRAHEVHDWLAQFLWHSHPPLDALAAAIVGAAAVLIVACPCAMGLATPVAIMAGTNSAARRGILIRDGIALEKAGQITAVMFDKTGTLTEGKPNVVATEVFDPSASSLFPPPSDGGEGENKNASSNFESRLAASLARRSNHPLSQSVAKLFADDFQFSNWREIRGSGVEAEFDSQTVRLGSLRWLKSSGMNLEAANAFEENWTSRGATILGFAQGTKLVAMFALEDTLKNGAANVVKQLGDENLSVYLITGDNARTAENIAKQTGIPRENVFAEIRPEEKSALVKKLQSRGERVAFVGDGINDAPALEQADLGIAVSKASDVANEAADIILLKSEIHSIPEALGLARATLRTIKQNLFWAFFYNAAGIPLAALGFLSPVLCAAAMGFSDVIVIGNALRLRRWKN